MKAASLQNHHCGVGEVPGPGPVQGQARGRTDSCGRGASDADVVHRGSKVVEMSQQYGGQYSNLDLSRIIVPGHEYVGEILDYGPGSRRPMKVGSMVTSAPAMSHAGGHSITGQSHDSNEEHTTELPAQMRT